MTRRIVYTDPPWGIVDGRVQSGWDDLERSILGPDVAVDVPRLVDGRFASALEDPDLVRGCHALVVYRQQVTGELLDLAGDGLVVVARQGVGTDNLSIDLLDRRGILGIHVPDYCVSEVADHTTALVLALERGIVGQSVTLAAGTFDILGGGAPRRLADCTAAIIGFGRIGRAVALRLRTIYGRVLVVDPFQGGELAIGYGCVPVDFKTALRDADVITLHCDLNDRTAGMISADALARMKPTTLLVNAARGALIDRVALRDAVLGGTIGGAALDVFVPEDPHDEPGTWAELLAHPRVVGTSHRAFLSEAAELASRRRIAAAIRDVLESGRAPDVGVCTRSPAPVEVS